VRKRASDGGKGTRELAFEGYPFECLGLSRFSAYFGCSLPAKTVQAKRVASGRSWFPNGEDPWVTSNRVP
jgi:coproporphyrinogen III oxidase